jgi:hypothetical protein
MALVAGQGTEHRYRMELVALQADEGRAWADREMLTGRQLIDPDRVSHAAEVGPGGFDND